ncbi:MAG: alpha-E domain-containing protein [Planctomycetota bacterium]|nr:MAG: alpha-E domain-containing protein [Planctomycetota bacterium]
MLSRVAEAIYWMARYVERAENIARFLDVTLSLSLDTPEEARIGHWHALVSTSGDEEWFAQQYGNANQDTVLRFLTSDRAYASSLISSVAQARENARSVREVLSREQWECLNHFYHMVQHHQPTGDDLEALAGFYATVRRQAALFHGMSDHVWSHDEGWQFLRLGTSIERADKTSRILDVKYYLLSSGSPVAGAAFNLVQWSALLSSASADQSYRQRYHETTPDHVIDFLVFDAHFPRSIRHCVDTADHALHTISGTPIGSGSLHSERLLGRLRAQLAYGNAGEVHARGLHDYLDDVQGELNGVSSAVIDDFFRHR